jgi:DNA-binding transcriptional MerR regulator
LTQGRVSRDGGRVAPTSRKRRPPTTPARERFRIEELAALASTTPRNVRAYRERGLLHAPTQQGRVAYYDGTHLARLRTIGALLERGYSIANIKELTAAWAGGRKLEDVLGLEQAITSPYADEKPEIVEAGRLLAELGPALTPATVARALELKVLVLEGAELRAPSPRLLAAGLEVARVGVPIDALLTELGALRPAVEAIARRFVRLFVQHLVPSAKAPPRGKALKELEHAVRRVRPLALRVVEVELAQALDREIRDQLTAELERALAGKAGAAKKRR